jgi:hypothetical protein
MNLTVSSRLPYSAQCEEIRLTGGLEQQWPFIKQEEQSQGEQNEWKLLGLKDGGRNLSLC